jgi:RHS repeat-associated protein
MDYARNPSPIRSPIPGQIRCPSQSLKPYNRSHMQPALDSPIPDASLAVFPVNGENSHQGLASENPALYPGHEVCNFTVLLGLQSTAVLNRVGPRSTGKERDTESGNDYFEARYYGSSMGRMLSPDPIGGDITNPQSLNKYAYALNNSLRFTDPTGLYVCKDGKDGACTSDQDKTFEKSLAGLRGSSNADVARAAAAYGAAGDANGVTVGFADLSKSGEDGNVTSSLGTDANGNLQAQSDVTINTKASGSSFDAAIGHEGSHVADAQDVVKSIVVDPKHG